MTLKALVAACLGLAVAFLFAAGVPQTEITNDQMRAMLYLPDTTNGYYRGTRFDWSGVVGSLEFEGHNYYAAWFSRIDKSVRDFTYDGDEIVASPCTAITGPSEEFQPNLGWQEAKPGGTFIKIGVGVLRKDQANYDAFKLYDIVDPGRWTVKTGSNSVEFRHVLADSSSGYGYVYRKNVRLTDGRAEMVLEHSLRNTGTRTIQATVYNHNFLVLDKQPTGPDFSIRVPFQIKTANPPDKALAEVRGNQIVYLKTLQSGERVQTGIQGFSNSPTDYDFRIENTRTGAGVRITSDRPLARAMLWSIRQVLSVEPFIAIAVEPGGEFTWTITYEFYTLPPAAGD